MESIIGKQVRIIATEEELKRSGMSSPIRVNANGESSQAESFYHKIGKIVGVSGGRDYGDGIYDSPLYIVSFDMEDGTKKSIRIRTDYVEFINEAIH